MEVRTPIESGPGALMTANRYRVLLVENDESFSQAILEQLQENRHHLTTWVRTAEEVPWVLTREKIDVVLAAHALPGMDGLELARLIHLESGPPVIVTTGNWSRGLARQAYAAGVKALLRKPVSLAWMMRTVELVAGRGLHCVGQDMTGSRAQK